MKKRDEFNKPAADQWQDVTNGADAAAFDGIVAFETDAAYFGDQRNTWQKPGSSTYFGYIDNYARDWKSAEDRGPRLSRILTPAGSDGLCAVTATMLNYEGSPASFRMREATTAEVAAIKEAVASSQAKIEFNNPKAAQALGIDARKPQGPSSPTP